MEIIDKKKCTGCGSCKACCPYSAINMVEDKDGFLYPVVNKEKCKNCGLCRKKCPNLNIKNKTSTFEYYAGFSKDNSILKQCSSGGIFYHLARKFIEDGGIVYGVEFEKNIGANHIAVDKIESLNKILGSKYLQSNGFEKYKEIKEALEKGKKVMFSGTPCQIAGLNKFLGVDYDNLLTIDLICTGAPSKKVFNIYIKSLEKKYRKEFMTIDFRNKKNNWYNYYVKLSFKNKNKYTSRFFNPLIILHYKQLSLRKSCSECNYRKGKAPSDIQLGDFWNIQFINKNFYNKDGISVIIVKTPKGKKMFEEILEEIEYTKVTEEDVLKTNGAYNECKFNIKERNKFFKELDTSNNKYKVIRKYSKIKLIDKIKIKKNLFVMKLKNK